MFGYVNINHGELKVREFERYHAFYCGLCEVLRKKYGFAGQMTLSYDMTFLIILLNSLYELKEKKQSRRCKVHPLKKHPMIMSKASIYAADMEMLLSYQHLVDDWEDERKVSSKVMSWMIHFNVKKAEKKYPQQVEVFRQQLKELHQYEIKNETSLDLPANCFGRMMSSLFDWKQDHYSRPLQDLGFYLGKFVYLMDAYDDYEKDCKNQNYNVFRQFDDPEERKQKAKEALTFLLAKCTAILEYLPLERDLPILQNILYGGVWKRWNVLEKKHTEQEMKGKLGTQA